MGFIKVKAFIWNIFDPKKSRKVEFLADTGAIYTVLPETLLNQLNIRKIGRRKFRLADNRIVERDIGIIGIKINNRETHTIVVFGDKNIHILGITTLEELGLEIDPISRKLKEMELLLL